MVNEQAWANLEEDKANPQPTPPVGEIVRWYPGNDQRQPYAGRVTAHEGVGRIKIEIAQVNGFPQHKRGVYHVTSKVHLQKGNTMTRDCGSWDYVRGVAPDEDYAMHRDEIERREKNLLAAEEAANKVSERTSVRPSVPVKRKPLPEPLPANAF